MTRRPHVEVDVVWDGTRIYRVPTPGEIEAVLLASLGHTTRQASQLLGLNYQEGALARVNEVRHKLRALSAGDALYRLYRLQIVPDPRDPQLQPVLDRSQLDIFDALVRLGLPYDQAHKVLGMGNRQLRERMREICRVLGAATRVQAMRRAVETGDVEVAVPPQLWRGVV